LADASTQFYYLDNARNQQGPVPVADVARLIRDGAITRETQVWHAGMPDWRAAGQLNEFALLFGPPGPPPMRPPMPPAGGAMPMQASAIHPAMQAMPMRPGAAGPTDTLVPSFAVWGLFWRALLSGLGNFVIIPSPWTSTVLYRFLVVNTSLPDGRRLTFAGQAGDIWYVFIGMGLVGLVGQVIPFAILITLPVSLMLSWVALRWVCEKTGAQDGSVRIAFTGGMWGFVGWGVLLILSFITIIGWAWVLRILISWICRNVSGTHRFEFTGTGLGILGRTLLFMLVCIFIIPIPWMLRWFYRWLVSRVRVADSNPTPASPAD
jgi:hypothetical protein